MAFGSSLIGPWLQAYPWKHVVFLNKQLCRESKLPFGPSNGHDTAKIEWESFYKTNMDFEQMIDRCRKILAMRPFLSLNEKTFARIAKFIAKEIVKNVDPLWAKEYVDAVECCVKGELPLQDFHKIHAEIVTRLRTAEKAMALDVVS